MATNQMYSRCEESIKALGIREIRSGKLVNIDLAFIGCESLVDESELVKLSESEQRRHKGEDMIMLLLYGNAKAERIGPIPPGIIAPRQNAERVAK